MIKNKKVIFLNLLPSPYRVDFFNELDKVCDLLVIYYFPMLENSPWKDSDKAHNYQYEYLFDSTKVNFGGLVKIVKILHKYRKEIIIVGGYAQLPEIISIFYLKLFGIKFSLNTDGGFVTKGFFKTIFKNLLIRSANYWLSSGKRASETLEFYGAKQAFIYEYHFTSLLKGEILSEPVKKTEVENLRKTLNLDKDTCYFIFVGQLIHRKGVDIMLASLTLTQNNKFEILVVGDGDQSSQLREISILNKLNKRVHFLGKLSKKEVLDYLKVSDVFVFPSRDDIWGLVLNEAGSSGLPIITSEHVGSAYSLVEDGKNGYMVKNTPIEWANAIDKITNQDMRKMGNESIKIAQKYSIEQMVQDHMILFSKLGA